MPSNRDVQNTIRLYLLGRLDGGARDDFEKRLLTEDDLFEQLVAIEDELIDEYLAGNLGEDDIQMFEKKSLATPERLQKLRFAKALRKYAKVHLLEESPQAVKPSPRTWNWSQLFANPYLRSAAFAALVVIAALGVWRVFISQSDVDKGLIALRSAYREQRPLQSRITPLDYAPFVTKRGGPERVNSDDLNRAERILMDAEHDHPSADSHHALGNLYLSKKEVDSALDQFQKALKYDPNKAQIYADLGAAFLEKGRLELEKAKAEKGSEVPGFELLGQSRANLNRALQLKPDLLEPLYNRALVNELQLLRQQAKSDWLDYLKRDPNSRWATEAGEHLRRLEEEGKRQLPTNEPILKDFLSAYESKDDVKASRALNLSRAREGNRIVEALLDDYLFLAASGQTDEAADRLSKITYAGNVERLGGDFYTSDLARFYGGTSAADRTMLVEARSLMKATHRLYGNGAFALAASNYLRARELFAEVGDQCEVLLADSWVGYSYLRIPKTEESIQLFERLSRDFETKTYRYLFAQSLPALADAESSRNEFSRTLDYDYRCLKESQKIGDAATGVRCLGQIVSMYLALGDYRRSLESVIEGIDLADTLPHSPTLIWQFYHQAALDFHFLKFPDSALAFEEEALRLADASRVPLLKSRSWERRGVLYGQQKNHDEAVKSGERALAEAEKVVDDLPRKNLMARSLLTLGKLRSDAGDPRRAIFNFDQSITLYRQLDFQAYAYEAHKEKLLALIAVNDNAAADAELREVLALFEQYRDKILEESSRDSFFDAAQDTYDVAIDFAYSRMNDPVRALEYAEASRARSLFEMMKTGTRIIGDRGRPEIKLQAQTKPLTLQQIRSRMPDRAQVLQFSLLADKLIAWVITREEVKSAVVPLNPDQLNRKIESYWAIRAGASRASTNETPADLSKQLHSSLIAPVENLLQKDLELCIVADKSLNYVPFATLISPATGRYLIEEYAVEMSPSGSVFVSSSERALQLKDIPDERLLSIGNPAFDRRAFPQLPDLPAAEREANHLRQFYPSSTILIGRDALPGRVRNEMASAHVIHFATHAVADDRSALLSKLLLASTRAPEGSSHHAGQGFLQASDIYELELPRTRLVVLSACQTSIERAYRGEGAVGLARPFLAKGVPIVIASLWPVDSEVTAELMISFHRHRREKKLSTVEALRQAQLEMIRNSQPGTPRGNGWAAFVAIGGYANF